MPGVGLDRHHHDMAVAHAALGDDVVGERLHLGAASSSGGLMWRNENNSATS
jgi:hypothetical protein